jgi:ribosomal protein S18 acetylase RimI-like enzyme
MPVAMSTPSPDSLGEAVAALRRWQRDEAPMQLHPGDIGWFWRHGGPSAAAAVRTWSRDGQVLAVGLLDGSRLLRMTTAPDARQDDELARTIVGDVTRPGRGVLPGGRVAVEAPQDALIQDALEQEGWKTDEPWTPLRRDLREPVPDRGVRIEMVGPDRARERAAVQRAAFDNSTFSEDRWHAMAGGLPYAEARCLVAYDDTGSPGSPGSTGVAVAAVTVWSAGEGRPGLLEPMGVHRDHRGRGFGTAITVAAAAALREMGASSALVCTPSANVGAVATYRSAGFQACAEVRDRYREA